MQVPYTNHKAHAVHIGGKRIDPGETREVDASLAPRPAAAQPAAPDPDAGLRTILEHKATEIPDMLASLSDDELGRLEALEGDASKPRKTVLQAIEETRLERAKARQAGDDGGDADGEDDAGGGTPGDPDLENFRAEIQELPDGELDDIRTLYEDTDGYAAYVEAVDAEKARRQGDGGA